MFSGLCGRGWWVTLVALGYFGSASGFRMSLLSWVPIAKFTKEFWPLA